MHKLVQGVHHFQENIFSSQRELFERLVGGQNPDALFITCSDSRINPNLITQTGPGELFILRNAGNLVPPFGASNGGEGATIEFAIVGLNIKDIIVCGHSHCGAIKALLNPNGLGETMPLLQRWLGHAESTRWIVREKYPDLDGQELLNVAIQEHVLVQLENLRSHPAVAARVACGALKLHGWVYEIETGQVFAYDPEAGQFAPITAELPQPLPAPARLNTAVSI
jgi:carbonic anhydrase